MNNSLKTRLLESKRLKNNQKQPQKTKKTATKRNKNKQLVAKSDKENSIAKKLGRPNVITKEVETRLESALQNGATIERASAYAGIDPATYYRKMKVDKRFARKMTAAKEYTNIAATKLLTEDIVINKNVETAKWWASRKMKDEFGDSGGGVNVGVQINQDMKKYAD